MDGTLCDVSPIRHLLHLSEKGKNFHLFHMASVDCQPIPEVVQGVRDAQMAGRVVLVVTARDRRYRHVTAFWLALWGIHSDRLFMRHFGDMRSDAEIKKDILTSIQRRWKVVRAWDDNPSIWALWEAEGIPVEKIPGWIEL